MKFGIHIGHMGGPLDEMRKLARSQGMRTLQEDGIAKIRGGETSLAEVARVTG